MTEELYWFWFCGLKRIGIRTRHRLLDAFDDAKSIFDASGQTLESLNWLSKDMREEILGSKNMEALKRNYDIYYRKGFRFIHILSPEYPHKLKNIYEYPIGLYYKGRLPDDTIPSVAIVGARYCTTQGKVRAMHFAKVLSEAGVQIISGMALGIDGSAHRGAMEVHGYTCAVFGNGIDICYPRENWHIYQHISDDGGCISEYPPGARPAPWCFPQRNRIISGLSDIVMLIEAREKSGALITADYALEQGKDVYAVPGRPEDALSKGCNELIKSGAALVNGPEELVKILGLKVQIVKKNNIFLDKSENLVYSSLCLIPKNIEDICREFQMDINEGYLVFHKLERMGLIRQVRKNDYILNC